METIYAHTGVHALLEDGEVAIMGYKRELNKRYTIEGFLEQVTKVDLYLYNGLDSFFFENNKMVYQCLSINTPAYLTDIYQAAFLNKATEKEFLDKVVEAYTLTKMGF